MADYLNQAWPYAAAVLVVLGIIALVFLIIILVRVSKTMKSVQSMAEQAEKEVTPALAKVNPMVDKAELLVDTVNLEMLRVDAILEDVEQVSNVAGKTATTVDTVTSAPAEAVTSLVDRIRGSIGSKRADKLKQSRVVFPIGSGEDVADKPAAANPDTDKIDLSDITSHDDGQASGQAAGCEANDGAKLDVTIPDVLSSKSDAAAEQPLGKHSVTVSAVEEDTEQESAE